MSTLEALAPGPLAVVAELTARLKHDLGKYVAFGARWLPEDADVAARREALTDDLLRTRRGPDGEQDAGAVWAPYREALTGARPLATGIRVDLGDDPGVARIVELMGRLEGVLACLRADEDLDEAAIDDGLAICREVSTACRDLHKRAQEARRTHG